MNPFNEETFLDQLDDMERPYLARGEITDRDLEFDWEELADGLDPKECN